MIVIYYPHLYTSDVRKIFEEAEFSSKRSDDSFKREQMETRQIFLQLNVAPNELD